MKQQHSYLEPLTAEQYIAQTQLKQQHRYFEPLTAEQYMAQQAMVGPCPFPPSRSVCRVLQSPAPVSFAVRRVLNEYSAPATAAHMSEVTWSDCIWNPFGEPPYNTTLVMSMGLPNFEDST
jgi:hypothetical protein